MTDPYATAAELETLPGIGPAPRDLADGAVVAGGEVEFLLRSVAGIALPREGPEERPPADRLGRRVLPEGNLLAVEFGQLVRRVGGVEGRIAPCADDAQVVWERFDIFDAKLRALRPTR